MENIWNTVGTILATGIVITLGNWTQHFWTRKREVSDARRKYREGIAIKVREALEKMQDHLAWGDLINIILEAENKGAKVKPEYKAILEESKANHEAKSLRETLTEFFPLTSAISDEVTRKAVKEAFGYATLNRGSINLITEDELKQKIKLAYKKLEDFVTSAD